MKFFALFSFLFLLLANQCGQKESNCLEEKITAFAQKYDRKQAVSIFTFESGGESYTVFDNGIAFDAQAYVLNSACDTVYIYGGMMLEPDASDPPFDMRDMNNRTQIWPE